ncbi:MAG TPA: cytochrome c oxidase assembly protein [Acidimicrobiia bacterium]|nr:cytochrome c oxidase assembly protein [Acidimicrobiia bacterium]
MIPPFHPHFDVWAILGTVGFAYWFVNKRIRPHWQPAVAAPSRRQWALFYVGFGFIWLASDWPIHDLAEESLYSVHMAEHMVITLIGPPLMVLGLNRGLADRLFGHRLVKPWLSRLGRPAPAFAIYNVGMIVTHWPEVVSVSVTSELAHFGFHVFLFMSGVLLWLPVLSPSTVVLRLRPPMRLLYLFFNSILPTVPAGFLTFSHVALYPIYGDASLAFGISAITDQTLAGLIMKLGGTLLIWIVMGVIWFRWEAEERRWDEIEEDLRTKV